MTEPSSLRGTYARALPRPSRTHPAGRVCANDGCETRLSIYNRSTYCWAHAPVRFPVSRGERRHEAA